MYTTEDLKQLAAKGMDIKLIDNQLSYFKSGFPHLRLARAATVGDGIRKLLAEETKQLESIYDSNISNFKTVKFVPASGAATRMFKDLYEYLQSDEDIKTDSVAEVFHHLHDFAFYNELGKIMNDKKIKPEDDKKIASLILSSDGLNYGNLPKGMLLFHKYGDHERTALEEHMAEGAMYARNKNGKVHIHFTVSPEHIAGFEELVRIKKQFYEDKFNVGYEVSFSVQKPSTDTIAVNHENEPMRNKDGSLMFRPGGHGALLENLNDLDGDIIFIKNIDNVVPDRLKSTTIEYKKSLAGLLIRLQIEIFSLIEHLKNHDGNEDVINRCASFMKEHLSFEVPQEMTSWPPEEQTDYLLSVLQRPLRVCGMVRNEGEPGGGPFWVKNNDGSTALQIVESSQIDMADPEQKKMASDATHFNPVDLVCTPKDIDGNKFDLLQYRDPNTGFISAKSKDGISLKAQELPGLWNGAMAHWNTVFVEVPIETFNPVKTINDLLRPQHQ